MERHVNKKIHLGTNNDYTTISSYLSLRETLLLKGRELESNYQCIKECKNNY
jgi:hypothetical protein